MIKSKFLKISLRQGESLNWENFDGRICLLVLKGSMLVFSKYGKVLFRLDAGEANIFEGVQECTGTSFSDETEVIIV